MTDKIHLAVTGMLTFNAFLAGKYWEDSYKYETETAKKIEVVFWALLWLLVGFPFIILAYIIKAVIGFIVWVNLQTQAKAWFSLWFTRQWDKATDEVLYKINEAAAKKVGTGKFKDIMYIKAVKAVNKRRNYKYEPKPQIDF